MKLFTIGYSGYEREDFVRELKDHGVDLVLDVRSLAVSRYRPEYDCAAIEKYLKENGVRYLNMPEEFGARQENEQYQNQEGYVDFELFAQSDPFRRGVMKVSQITQKGMKCALMCAEKDAMNCHRSILIARRFCEMGWTVIHLSPGWEEKHEALETRLLNAYYPNRFQLSLLEEPKEEREWLNEAYRQQNRKIGFRKE